jgi:hypothetical protein
MFIAERIRATISRGCGSIETVIGFSSQTRLLQRFELAVQQASQHKMLVPVAMGRAINVSSPLR